jgi:hypothetical protein
MDPTWVPKDSMGAHKFNMGTTSRKTRNSCALRRGHFAVFHGLSRCWPKCMQIRTLGPTSSWFSLQPPILQLDQCAALPHAGTVKGGSALSSYMLLWSETNEAP